MIEKYVFVEHLTQTTATRKDGKVKVRAGSGYGVGVNKLCTLKDTGNGFFVKFHSHNSAKDPIYFSMDYSHASYLLMALLAEYAADETFEKMELIRQGAKRVGMKELTDQELYEMYGDALEAYDSAVENQMLDDEEHDKIVDLRGELDAIAYEIYRRKGEQG